MVYGASQDPAGAGTDWTCISVQPPSSDEQLTKITAEVEVTHQ